MILMCMMHFPRNKLSQALLKCIIACILTRYSCENNSIVIQNDENESNAIVIGEDVKNFKIGEWYVVDYEGKCFPGEVVAIEQGEYKVSVMEPAGAYWKWPNPRDIIFYIKEKIICRLSIPEVVNNKGNFKFLDI